MHQKAQQRRYVNHQLYASPVRRGENIEVIEDILPVYGVEVTVRVRETVKRVYLAPQNEDIGFTQTADGVAYVVPKLDCYQMVVLEYGDYMRLPGKRCY